MSIGKSIKAARKKAGISQKELGAKLGVSGSMIGQYETGVRSPKIETLQAIADVLRIHVFELTGIEKKFDKYQILIDPPLDVDLSSPKEIFDSLSADDKKEFWKILNVMDDPDELKDDLLTAYDCLNPSGQQEAVKRVEELTEIPRYQRQEPQDGPGASNKGEDTPDTQPPPETPTESKK